MSKRTLYIYILYKKVKIFFNFRKFLYHDKNYFHIFYTTLIICSILPRFPKQLNHEGHGRHLGPGSYKNIHPYTSTARYLTTDAKARKSPRTYSIMKSSTKRFGKNSFLSAVGSGSSSMWPPMRPRH